MMIGARTAAWAPKGEKPMKTITTTAYLNSGNAIVNWLKSLGYTPNSPCVFFHVQPWGKDNYELFNPHPLFIFPNYNGTNRWGLIVARSPNNFGTDAGQVRYLDGTSEYLAEGDSLQVIEVASQA